MQTGAAMNERESGEREIKRRVAGLQHAVDQMSGLTDGDRIADLIATGRRGSNSKQQPCPTPVRVPRDTCVEPPKMPDFEKSR